MATLCCIVDGMVLLEQDDYAVEAIAVLLNLVSLGSNGDMGAPVKVLFTTTNTTMDIRGAVDEEGLVLNVGTLTRPWSTSSEAGIIRELDASVLG
ncbi:hypothetical protein N7468_003760 [Penicillium chermesinum]|uniref:Uncharacterized protein n=1 Tax=Penicillium chermesinum TaxID=63820 RepID=A0A9W9P7S6_9EURO|nr:uncharacterized protein N7468_003760 [Penicillium chermesinum]KAJ5239141.1 hypothetical protein N7468_003760 [Penicillium chermesinum]KAJ6164782.1 hypothetical protein N7470_003454 [Penicillium chermesinum]